MKELKLNDVYRIRYTDEYKKTQSPHTDFNWCFEGLGVVVKNYQDELVIADTFWDIGRYKSDNKSFKIDEVGAKINVEYYCNIDDLEPIKHYDIDYYSNEDLFRLHRQHGCDRSCVYWYKKKGAIKSTEKMKSVILNKISSAKSTISCEQRSIEMLKETLVKVENGETDGIFI